MPDPAPDADPTPPSEAGGPPVRGAIARWTRGNPVLAVFAGTLLLRTAIVLDAWASNPLVARPQLDGEYYLTWAAEIAQGDVLGRAGLIGGDPFLLNPLLAYLLAPFVALAGSSAPLAAGLVNAALGAGTAALAAASARRFSGTTAAWIAGLLTGFSAVLAQLDCHVAVSETAAFLVAGACFAASPALPGDRRGAHGPAAIGLWLGIGALARPVTLLALPFLAWLAARNAAPGRRLRAAAVVVLVFFLCAVPTALRNRIVSGTGYLWTGAGGINLHLGNNPAARARRTMVSDHFRFDPVTMHQDARLYVREKLGRDPTREEVSSFFVTMTFRELTSAPAASLAHYGNKLRWFAGPREVPSSVSYGSDRTFQSVLPAAFVPTWCIVGLGVAGAVVLRRRRDLLLGPGGLAAAHVAMLTLVFPLSHYRSPSVPAFAVLGGCGIAAAIAALRAGGAGRSVRPLLLFTGVAVGTAVAGALPPRPDSGAYRDHAMLAVHWRDTGAYDAAEREARAALTAAAAEWPDEREPAFPWALLGEIRCLQRRFDEAREPLEKAVALDRYDPTPRLNLAAVYEKTGRVDRAESEARALLELYPDLGDAHAALGSALSLSFARRAEAQAHLRRAMELGARPEPAALRRAGLGP